MKYFIRFIFIFLLVVSFSFVCLAAEPEEKGLSVSPSVSRDKIILVKVVIDSANGGPKLNTLQLDYPRSTVLITSASLTVKKGSCKIELLENNKPVLTLSSKEGKTVKTGGRMTMDEEGALQYRVTAKKAKNIAFDLSFVPFQEELRVSRAYSEKKFSSEGDGLNLKLTCIAGKNCSLQVQNVSKSKAYRNILFRIDYKMMAQDDALEKTKCGVIEAALFPGKTGEWPVDLVFGEPPKDIKISLIKADEVDPAGVTAAGTDQGKDMVIKLIPPEEQKKNDPAEKSAVPVNAAPSIPAPLSGKTAPVNSSEK